jgi:hypothetical protein
MKSPKTVQFSHLPSGTVSVKRRKPLFFYRKRGERSFTPGTGLSSPAIVPKGQLSTIHDEWNLTMDFVPVTVRMLFLLILAHA